VAFIVTMIDKLAHGKVVSSGRLKISQDDKDVRDVPN